VILEINNNLEYVMQKPWCADVLICTKRHQLKTYMMQRGTFAYHNLHTITFAYHFAYHLKILCRTDKKIKEMINISLPGE
jgi:hypothetical protein